MRMLVLLKLVLKNLKVSFTFQVESDGLIRVSVNLIIPVFIILSSPNIPSTCFESDITLCAKNVVASSDMI